jgi:hypothetical protein
MSTATADSTDQSISWEACSPVLLNTWKHHASFLRMKIRAAVGRGPSGLAVLANELVVLGAQLMDLYYGVFTPREIGERVIDQLKQDGRFEPEPFREWTRTGGGYGMLVFAEDGSQWVMRFGEGTDRYLHVHPGRWTPLTCRVRANVLKTAVMASAHALLYGGEPTGLETVNRVRQTYLNLAPVGKSLKADEGLGSVIDLLKESP